MAKAISYENPSLMTRFKAHIPKIIIAIFIIACIAACYEFSKCAAGERYLAGDDSWTRAQESLRFYAYTTQGALYITGAVATAVGATLVGIPLLLKKFQKSDEDHPEPVMEFINKSDLRLKDRVIQNTSKFLSVAVVIGLLTACIFLAVKASHGVTYSPDHEWSYDESSTGYTSVASGCIAGSFFTGLGAVIAAACLPVALWYIDNETSYYQKKISEKEAEKFCGELNPDAIRDILFKRSDGTYSSSRIANLGPFMRAGWFDLDFLERTLSQAQKYHDLKLKLEGIEKSMPKEPKEQPKESVGADEALLEADVTPRIRAENTAIIKRNQLKQKIRDANKKIEDAHARALEKWREKCTSLKEREAQLRVQIEEHITQWKGEASQHTQQMRVL